MSILTLDPAPAGDVVATVLQRHRRDCTVRRTAATAVAELPGAGGLSFLQIGNEAADPSNPHHGGSRLFSESAKPLLLWFWRPTSANGHAVEVTDG